MTITFIKINKNRQGNNKGEPTPSPSRREGNSEPPPDLPLGGGKRNLPLAPPEGKGTLMKMERMHDKHTSTLLSEAPLLHSYTPEVG